MGRTRFPYAFQFSKINWVPNRALPLDPIETLLDPPPHTDFFNFFPTKSLSSLLCTFVFNISRTRYHMLCCFVFTGADKDVDSAARFIQNLFQIQSTNPCKVIYPHFTTATDTSNIQVVFQVVMDSILRENLRNASIL